MHSQCMLTSPGLYESGDQIIDRFDRVHTRAVASGEAGECPNAKHKDCRRRYTPVSSVVCHTIQSPSALTALPPVVHAGAKPANETTL